MWRLRSAVWRAGQFPQDGDRERGVLTDRKKHLNVCGRILTDGGAHDPLNYLAGKVGPTQLGCHRYSEHQGFGHLIIFAHVLRSVVELGERLTAERVRRALETGEP